MRLWNGTAICGRNIFARSRNIVLLFSIALTFNGLECRRNPASPPPTDICEYPPGNRSFTWRIDTVAWWPSEVGGVWAFSDTDVWVMGNMHGPTVPGQTSYLGLHWNGNIWNDQATYDQVQELSVDVTGDSKIMVSVGYWLSIGDHAAIAEFRNDTKKWTTYQFDTNGDLYGVWTDGEGYFISVGTNGMVYTKDGYSSTWAYSKVPTSFILTRVVGVSKNEIYVAGVLNVLAGKRFEQYWKFDGFQWRRLFDTQDTLTQVISLPGDPSFMTDVACYRCPMTDSLTLYLAGSDSYVLKAKGQSLDFSIENLTDLGLPMHSLGITAGPVDLFTPNDFWILSTRYYFYQWNGSDFQPIEIPGLPTPGASLGHFLDLVKTKSGTIYFSCEVSSQVYVVARGIP